MARGKENPAYAPVFGLRRTIDAHAKAFNAPWRLLEQG